MRYDIILRYNNSFLLSSALFLNVGSWQSQNQTKKKRNIKKVSSDNSLGFLFSLVSEKDCIWSLCLFNLAPKNSEFVSQNQLKL